MGGNAQLLADVVQGNRNRQTIITFWRATGAAADRRDAAFGTANCRPRNCHAGIVPAAVRRVR
jgi:hypothetical protein